MAEGTEPPPPPYEEAVHLYRDTQNLSASDPLLGRRNGDQGTSSSQDRRSQQYLTREKAGSSQSSRYVSDSPHSSDDEETAMLKAELRKLRQQDRNEEKKALLRLMIEQEREASAPSSEGAAPIATRQWHPPPPIQHTFPGAIIHPVATNRPGQTGSRSAGPQSYAAPLQCPSVSRQDPGPSSAPGLADSPASGEEKEGIGCAQCVAVFICVSISCVIIVILLTSLV